MRIPSSLIMLPCLVAFVLCLLRFYQSPNRPGVGDIRFVSGTGAIVLAIVYLLADVLSRDRELVSEIFFGLALTLLIWSIVLFRRPIEKNQRLG